jgi:hypothetical protein
MTASSPLPSLLIYESDIEMSHTGYVEQTLESLISDHYCI